MKLCLDLSTTSLLVLLAASIHYASASGPLLSSPFRSAPSPVQTPAQVQWNAIADAHAAAKGYPISLRLKFPLRSFHHTSPLLAGAKGFRAEAFNAITKYAEREDTWIHFKDVMNKHSDLSAGELVTAVYKEIPKLDDPDLQIRRQRSFPGVADTIHVYEPQYPSYLNPRETGYQFWYLAEHYYSKASELTTLCPRLHEPITLRDDALEILIPSVCGVWDAVAQSLRKSPEDEIRRLVSRNDKESIFLMSNVPQLIKRLSHSGVFPNDKWSVRPDDILSNPERANIAYVTIPYQHAQSDDDYRYRDTNMVRLWRHAVREIRKEAKRLHRENGGNVNVHLPRIAIKILWNFVNFFDADSWAAIPRSYDEIALKIIAIRLADCVDAILLVSFEGQDQLNHATNNIYALIDHYTKDLYPEARILP